MAAAPVIQQSAAPQLFRNGPKRRWSSAKRHGSYTLVLPLYLTLAPQGSTWQARQYKAACSNRDFSCVSPNIPWHISPPGGTAIIPFSKA